MQHGAQALAVHRFFFRLALAAGNTFAWIFVFRSLFLATGDIDSAIVATCALYVLSQSIAFLLTPITGAALRRGIIRAVIFGSVIALGAFLYLALLFTEARSTKEAFVFLASFALLSGLHRALYWIPYSVAKARETIRPHYIYWRELAIACMPFLAGYMILAPNFGAGYLYMFVLLLLASSILPLWYMRESYEKYTLTYRETLSALFAPTTRHAFMRAFFDGTHGVGLLLLWPLAAFLVLNQSFLDLGAIISITLVITLTLKPFFRTVFTSTLMQNKIVHTTLFVIGWISRVSVATPVGIIIADTIATATVRPKEYRVDHGTHEQMADAGHYVDEMTALHEMGMMLGRIALALVCIVVTALGGVWLGFTTAFACIIFGALYMNSFRESHI